MLFLLSCNESPNIKGKKGDFSFRKCTNCKVLEE